jgi:hypothetical protein
MKRNFCRILLSAACLATATANPGTAVAQEDLMCAPEEIETALGDLECVAEGIFLSAESALDAIAERCEDAPSEKACRKCFRKVHGRLNSALKALGKLGLLERSVMRTIKESLAERAEETCAEDIDDSPTEGEDDPPASDSPVSSPPADLPNFGEPPPQPPFLGFPPHELSEGR